MACNKLPACVKFVEGEQNWDVQAFGAMTNYAEATQSHKVKEAFPLDAPMLAHLFQCLIEERDQRHEGNVVNEVTLQR